VNEEIVNIKIPKPNIKDHKEMWANKPLGMLFLDRKHIIFFNGLPKTCI
jgi:hypothetical protein